MRGDDAIGLAILEHLEKTWMANVLLLKAETIQNMGGESISTHRLPLRVVSNFIKETMGADAAIIGVQPMSVAFGKGMTPASKEAAKRIAETIHEAIIQAGAH